MEKNPISRGNPQQTAKAKPQTKEARENRALPRAQSVLAMLDAASAVSLGQLAGEDLLSSAGRLGNQSLLAMMEARSREPVGLRSAAAILEGAVIPGFEEALPAQAVQPREAFPPAEVPQFAYFGGRPAGFEAILDMAVNVDGGG